MLRITIHNSPREIRLHLEGKLAGPWVRELELCWQTAQSTIRDKRLTVDLREVDFVDSAGEQLLAAMHQHGAKFLAGGPLTRSLVSAITGEPEQPAGPAVAPRRKARLRLRLLALFLMVAAAGLSAELPKPEEAIARYVSAARLAASKPQDAVLDVVIDAKLPRLHRRGRLRAVQFISGRGRASYRTVRFDGDLTIEKNVIARYLSVDEAARTREDGSLAVTPANYRFHFGSLTDYNGAPAYVFRVEPRRKRVGLFRGELWVDAATFLPVRQWGELVKSPSLFVKRIYFVRDYVILGGRSVPRRTIADIDTRLVGSAVLTVWFELRCAMVEETPTVLGKNDVGPGSSIVGPNACTL